MTAYILRTVSKNFTSCHGTFKWPKRGRVVAPDWEPTEKCGNGLHGFLWGQGDGSLACWSDDAVWIVAKIKEWIDLGGKVKFPEAYVVFHGKREDAIAYIKSKGAEKPIIGDNVSAGDRGYATAGNSGKAAAGKEGIIIISYYDGKRDRIAIGYVGEDNIKPDTFYHVVNGELVEVT